jgi:hypothetical protein
MYNGTRVLGAVSRNGANAVSVRPAVEYLVSLGMSINSVISLACYIPFVLGYLLSRRAVSRVIADAQRLAESALTSAPDGLRDTAASDRVELIVVLTAAALSFSLGIAHATAWCWAYANGISAFLPFKLVSFHLFISVGIGVLSAIQIKGYRELRRLDHEYIAHKGPY